jgi:uncharacterized protein with NRDE domain
MRLWSLHPSYLDRQGLVALWREGLLARAVLSGQTKGYRHHPQLQRFRAYVDGWALLDVYLGAVCDEAYNRGYNFNRDLICNPLVPCMISVSTGQVDYEWQHLQRKLTVRSAVLCKSKPKNIKLNPIFYVIDGPIEAWEKNVF